MVRVLRSLLAVTLVIVAPASAEHQPTVISAASLARDRTELVGRAIAVHGCITKHQHGLFISPCGEPGWRRLTIVQDPESRILDAMPVLRRKIFYQVNGEFWGAVVREESTPSGKSRVFFRTDSVRYIIEHEP
jgi:hypothetical protein